MTKIIIVGAGGFGRELLQWIKDINIQNPDNAWSIKGFIDDNTKALDGLNFEYDIIGTIKDWKPSVDEVFACAIADPKTKEKVVKLLKSKGAIFEPIIHPTAIIGDNNKIGEGFVAYPFALVTTNATVGNFVTLLSSGVGHDVVIEDYSTISSYCDLTGGVKLGKRVFLGSHATIIPGRKIGNDCFIAAGSVVMTNLKVNSKVIGNPATKMQF